MVDSIAIRTKALSRSFGALVAVDKLNLDIPEASIFGFLGPNGCGKSTTIRMLCGLLKPSSGSATVLGVNATKNAEALKHKIGYMTQRFSLYEDLTVLENLRFMGEIYQLPKPHRNAQIDKALKRFELDDRTHQLAGTLSGGQKQRLALSAVTLHEPQLLFLDEPTSAVDPESRRQFWEFLFDMIDQGTTILVTTHFMDEAERCHKLAILDDGVLVANGSPVDMKATLPATVIEIEALNARQIRKNLILLDEVIDVAQLGTRLHALVKPEQGDPLALIQQALELDAAPAKVSLVPPNLEDVFVIATQRNGQ